jgi:peptide/nickel transport system permease protein/oligopeptide transport system permease protein
METNTLRKRRDQTDLDQLIKRRKENYRDKIKFVSAFFIILIIFAFIFTMLDRTSTLGPIDMSTWLHRIIVVCIYIAAFSLFMKIAYKYYDKIFFKFKTNTWELMYRRFKRNNAASVGLLIIISLAILAIFADLLAPYPNPGNNENYDPDYTLKHLEEAPSKTHILGTTRNGKDMLSVLIHGSRISLTLGLSVQLTATTIGITIGSIAAYYSGWVDKILNVINDIVMAFPFLLFIIVLVSILREVYIAIRIPFTETVLIDTPMLFSMWNGLAMVFIALAFLGWSGTYRVVRGQILSVKEMEFVEAARAVGANDRRIILKHILPNVISPIIVLLTLGIAGVILTEAALSYLGFGAAEGSVSWGRAIFEGRSYATTSKSFLVIFPGLAIVISILGFNSFGDGLRDALDPRMKR